MNGRLGSPVSCPQCGRDGTGLANNYIAKVERGENPLQQPTRSWLNFGLGKPKRRLDPDDLRDPREIRRDRKEPKPRPPTPGLRLGLGAMAALVTGVLGAFGWQWIAMKTGFHFGFLAWVIGGVVGLVSRLAVPGGSFALASLAGMSTFASVLAGHVLVMQVEVDKAVVRGVNLAYEMNLEYARRGVKLATDREIKEFLAYHDARTAKLSAKTKTQTETGQKLSAAQQRELQFMSVVLFEVMEHEKGGLAKWVDRTAASDPDQFTEEDVKNFREHDVPELQRLLNGQPSKAEWTAPLTTAIYERIHFKDLVASSIGPHTIAWMIFGLITAYKLAHNKSETEDV
ncbi:MAG: hypothetical protein HZA90_23910 [Verrucomicrobia bacterium]|nr:hypothetical protein [Verrucomicrobiota bacterium]